LVSKKAMWFSADGNTNCAGSFFTFSIYISDISDLYG
jgi:hypothetical protein